MLTALRCRRGLAGIEFALVLPFLLLVLAGIVDLALGILMNRRLMVAADAVATIASTMAVQAASLNTLTGTQAWQATTAPFALFPDWRLGAVPGAFAITLSSVNFTSGGTAASVGWSVASPQGQPKLRACGTLASVSNGSPASLATLPAGVFGATSLLVADVQAPYAPMFAGIFTGTVTLMQSAYVSPRINNGVSLSGAFPGNSVVCP